MLPKISLALVVFLLGIFSLKTLPSANGTGFNPSQETGEYQANVPEGVWQGDVVPNLQALLPDPVNVLGVASTSKWIEVDLSDQNLKAHDGDRIVVETKISSGKFGKTPTGEFRIWSKFKYTKMEGGNKGTHTYYYLPNVPYTMFFYNDQVPKYKGFGLHGTYWHNNFGTPMSHGCVNLPTEMAAILYGWTDPQIPSGKNMYVTTEALEGTRIVIHE